MLLTYLSGNDANYLIPIVSSLHFMPIEGVYFHWTRLLDWNTGLDYWTDIFLVFTHVVVGLIDFH